MKKKHTYEPCVVDDTFSISAEVAAMSREEIEEALRMYEEERKKARAGKDARP